MTVEAGQASRCVVCGAENTVFPGTRSATTGEVTVGSIPAAAVTMRYPDGAVASACTSHSNEEAASAAILMRPFLIRVEP